MSSDETMGSENWFKEFDRMNHVLRAKPAEMGGGYRAVRVAILDTGVRSEFGRQIEKYKDFVTEDDMNPVDQEGHGTHAVQLIKKANNKADIYVGRVFRRRTADENTLSLMTEAVTYATHQWEVDIIVIPSGFQSESDDMIKAIEDARSFKVLIFAAASNYGNIAHISFPGRLYPNKKLFCMFSTDGYSRAMPNFNPSVSKAAGYSFAILGAGIRLHENGEDLSGTSFATMIGAGLASRILDFSRQEVMRKNIRRVERLQTVEGMTEIFNIMVGTGIDNKYHCITPWNILRSATPGDQSLQRSEQRLHVCESISRAMEGLYKL